MATIATSWEMLHPNFTEPQLLIDYNQASDVMDVLPGGEFEVKLDTEDKMVYLRRLAVRTAIAGGMANSNQLPSVAIATSLAQAPTYWQGVNAIYDHHQTNMAKQWGFSIVEANRLGMRQAHYQLLRDKVLFGEMPGEGLVEAANATSVTLPDDTYGASTFSTWDNGEMAVYLLGLMQNIKQRTYQSHVGVEFTILGPQEVVQPWEYQGLIQLTAFQRKGAGTESIGGAIRDILERNGDKVKFGYDDTLKGAGSGGTDVVLIVMPEVKVPKREGINTNEFAKLQPGFKNCTALYTDAAAPFEIPTPVPGGAIHVLSEWRATSGWPIRGEAITVLSGAA